MSTRREWLYDCEKCMQGGRDTPKSVSRSTYFLHRKTPRQTPAIHSASAKHTKTAPESTEEVQLTQQMVQASTTTLTQHDWNPRDNDDDGLSGHENFKQRDGELTGEDEDSEMQTGSDELVVDQEMGTVEDEYEDFYNEDVRIDQQQNANHFQFNFLSGKQ